MNIVTDNAKILNFQKQFENKLFIHFNKKYECKVGFMGGSRPALVFYSEKLDVWYSNIINNKKIENLFGKGKPKDKSPLSQICQINFPNSEINSNISGVFAEENNEVYILHRGLIGGGKKGVGKTLFMDNYKLGLYDVIENKKNVKLGFISKLSSNNLIDDIINYINEVERLKKIPTNVSKINFSSIENYSYTKESTENYNIEKKDIKIIERKHGLIVDALKIELVKLKYSVGNTKQWDLFIYKDKNINTLFEIKTSCATQDIYTAVGQLLLYQIPIIKDTKNKINLIAVLPNDLKEVVVKYLNSYGIKVLYYKMIDDKVEFFNLKNLIKNN